MKIWINAVGLAARGLDGWQRSQAVLRGEQPYEPRELDKYAPLLLPPNERRRATRMVRLAFRACEDMMNNARGDIAVAECAAVFASSGGDFPIVDQICTALCQPERQVSPTQFHNSVHNSAAGYWSLATGSRAPSTSLSAFDDSFYAGFLEAVNLCTVEQIPTILAVYDIAPPEPLQSKRPVSEDFGLALLLAPQQSPGALFALEVRRMQPCPSTAAENALLEPLRGKNPAARALPLLELLAGKKTGEIVLSGEHSPALNIEVFPCH